MGSISTEDISIYNVVGREAFDAIDKLGYDFLDEQGIPTQKARKYPNERKKLARKLKAERLEVIERHKISGRGRTVYFWYVLKKEGKEIAKSNTLILKVREE